MPQSNWPQRSRQTQITLNRLSWWEVAVTASGNSCLNFYYLFFFKTRRTPSIFQEETNIIYQTFTTRPPFHFSFWEGTPSRFFRYLRIHIPKRTILTQVFFFWIKCFTIHTTLHTTIITGGEMKENEVQYTELGRKLVILRGVVKWLSQQSPKLLFTVRVRAPLPNFASTFTKVSVDHPKPSASDERLRWASPNKK